MKVVFKDHPFDEVAETARREIAQGHWVCQKFSCAACRQRLTMDDANVFYTHGTCDKCGHVTDIRAAGCNYMLLKAGLKTLHQLASLGPIKAPARPGLTIASTPPEKLRPEHPTKQ